MLNLTNEFYKLINEGFIYEEDENGHNMSYGEYAAIEEHGRELIFEELSKYDNRLDCLEAFEEIMQTADDDAAMFFGLNEDDRHPYINYEEPDRSDVSEWAMEYIMEHTYAA